MNPIRKPTHAGTTQEYEFSSLYVTQFLVKNLSGGDVIVSFEPPDKAQYTWLIPDGCWQMVPASNTGVSRSKVYATSDATSARGVEIEAVKYRLQRG